MENGDTYESLIVITKYDLAGKLPDPFTPMEPAYNWRCPETK